MKNMKVQLHQTSVLRIGNQVDRNFRVLSPQISISTIFPLRSFYVI